MHEPTLAKMQPFTRPPSFPLTLPAALASCARALGRRRLTMPPTARKQHSPLAEECERNLFRLVNLQSEKRKTSNLSFLTFVTFVCGSLCEDLETATLRTSPRAFHSEKTHKTQTSLAHHTPIVYPT